MSMYKIPFVIRQYGHTYVEADTEDHAFELANNMSEELHEHIDAVEFEIFNEAEEVYDEH